ncbi:MAG: hypothetical protein CMJ31_01135 [Phycisphaerae bacterium]|nr:hypothetical protein [Phycisphaerae bacterium]
MIDFFSKLLDTSDFPARWHCGNWTAFNGWLHIVSDGLIFVAYAAIPAALFVLLRTRRDVAFPAIGWLFVAFILSCGLTHAVEASIFWWPAYRLSGVMKAVTAGVSLVTAAALVHALPAAIALPGVKRANDQLQAAIERERLLHDKLSATHRELETRTSRLAMRERRMRDALGAAMACGVSWEIETNRIVSHLGFFEAMRAADVDWNNELDAWTTLVPAEDADELREAARRAAVAGEPFHHRMRLLGHEERWDVRLTARPEPHVAGQPAVMSGMFGLAPSGTSRGSSPPTF